jgi:feruloyl esterase
VSNTYPGQNDNIIGEARLTLENLIWNERLQAVDGARWMADRGLFSVEMLKGVLGNGYATTTTDAGLGSVMDVSE